MKALSIYTRGELPRAGKNMLFYLTGNPAGGISVSTIVARRIKTAFFANVKEKAGSFLAINTGHGSIIARLPSRIEAELPDEPLIHLHIPAL